MQNTSGIREKWQNSNISPIFFCFFVNLEVINLVQCLVFLSFNEMTLRSPLRQSRYRKVNVSSI